MTRRSTVVTQRWGAFSEVQAYGGGGFWQENDELALDVLSREYSVCSSNARSLATVSLSDFDYRQNENGHKYVTIIGTYFTGCTPGRLDYPTLKIGRASCRERV